MTKTKLTLLSGCVLEVDDENLAKVMSALDKAARSGRFADIAATFVGDHESVPRLMRLNVEHISIIQRGDLAI